MHWHWQWWLSVKSLLTSQMHDPETWWKILTRKFRTRAGRGWFRWRRWRNSARSPCTTTAWLATSTLRLPTVATPRGRWTKYAMSFQLERVRLQSDYWPVPHRCGPARSPGITTWGSVSHLFLTCYPKLHHDVGSLPPPPLNHTRTAIIFHRSDRLFRFHTRLKNQMTNYDH